MRRLISPSLAGAQQITLKSYDASNYLLAEQQIGQSDYRQFRQTALTCMRHLIHHMHQMQVSVQGIARIEIGSNAPFLLFSLVCG